MKSRYSSAGYCHEHIRPDWQSSRVEIRQRYLRYLIAAGEDPANYADSHDYQGNTEYRIESADNFIYRH